MAFKAPCQLRLFPPKAELAPYIRHFWMLSNPAGAAPQLDFAPCDTGTGLTFHLASKPCYLQLHTLQPLHHGHAIQLDGPHLGSQPLLVNPATDSVGIRFHPAGLFPLLQTPLANHSIATELPPQQWQRLGLPALYQQLQAAPQATQRLALLQAWLSRHLQAGPNQHRALTRGLAQLQPQLSIQDWSEISGLSLRQMERQFKSWIGLSPRQYQRILRVKQLRQLFKQQPQLDTLAAMLSCGYYDQAHGSKDFKALMGLTPSHYRQLLR